MSYPRQVFINTVAQAGARFFSMAVSVVTAMILTRYLGPSGYGQYNTALSFVGFLAVLGDLGVYQILVRELSQHPERRKKILSNVLAWRVFSGGLVFFIIVLAGFCMPYEQVVKLAIVIETARSFVYLLRSFFTSLPQVHLRLYLSAWGEILGRGSYLLAVIAVALFKWGLLVLFALMFTSTVLETLWMFYSYRRLGGKLWLEWDGVFLKNFLKESLILGLAALLGAIHFRLDTVLLSVMKPSFDVGIYSAAYRIFQVLVMLPGVFLSVVFPRFSELARSEWKEFFAFCLNLLWFVVWPLVGFVVLFAPYMIQILAGGEYQASVVPLILLAFAMVGGFMYSGFSQMAIALHRQKHVVLVVALAVLINISLNLILIPSYSYTGAALATLVSEISAFLSFWWLFRQRLAFRIPIGLWFKGLGMALVVVAIGYGFRLLLPFSEFVHQHILLNLVEIGLIASVYFLVWFALALKFNLLPRHLLKEVIGSYGKA